MLKKILASSVLIFCVYTISAQVAFKAGWDAYEAKSVIHEYTYSYINKDEIKLSLIDSIVIYITADSSVVMATNSLITEKQTIKKVSFYNASKKLVKQEEFNGNEVVNSVEYRYDSKSRKIFQEEINKGTGNTYRKTYEYTTDKKTKEDMIQEVSYLNNKIEYYDRSYFDKNGLKYKEVRLNDNNKDIMHVETYTYNSENKLTHRSVFFPQFKVTKEFDENTDTQPEKCTKMTFCGVPDKASIVGRLAFMKKVLAKNQACFSDPQCQNFEYKFTSMPNCEIVVKTTKVNHGKNVIFKYRERY